MPPKKASNKKVSTKVSSADADVLNNGEKDVAAELANKKNLANGSELDETDDPENKLTSSRASKRGGVRAKNVDYTELESETPIKKPVAKGRGKKKPNQNEVIENERQEEMAIEENAEDVLTKPKGKARGGGNSNKTEAITKKLVKAVKTEIDETDEAAVKEFNKDKATELEKIPKASGGRRKKQEVVSKPLEELEVKPELVEEVVEEDSKKSVRSNKKIANVSTVTEPPKKKGRSTKKEKVVEKEEVEMIVKEVAPKEDVKEKKTAKRGRVASKTVNETQATELNGDAEEILPKKRSRKAASVEKEIIKEKSKKGRTKKADNVEKVAEGDSFEIKKDANVEVEHEKKEETDESASSNKKMETQTESAASALTEALKGKGGRKRAAPSASNKKTKSKADKGNKQLDDGVDNTELEDEADGSKTSKKSKTNMAPVNTTVTKYNKADFDLPVPNDSQAFEEPRFNLKISSWNVAGLRSWLKKDGLKFLEYEEPDIFCMQETKCTTDQLPEEVERIPGYHPYWLCMPGGYAGVAIYSKIMPINVEYGIGSTEFDDCGRLITAEYEKFFLINVYVPNSGRKLVNLKARMTWETLFQKFVQNLDARKPVIICGDMNVSHQEHDLANPKANTRNAGFTKEERDKMSELQVLGYIDSFRHLYPERKGAYTYWTYMANARSRNVGWRLDYFLVSQRIIERVVDNCIRSQCMGSDHCPITLFLKL